MLFCLTMFFRHKPEVLADQPIFKHMVVQGSQAYKFKVLPDSMSHLLPHGGAAESSFLQGRGENPAVLLRADKLHNHTGLRSKVNRVGTMHGNIQQQALKQAHWHCKKKKEKENITPQ